MNELVRRTNWNIFYENPADRRIRRRVSLLLEKWKEAGGSVDFFYKLSGADLDEVSVDILSNFDSIFRHMDIGQRASVVTWLIRNASDEALSVLVYCLPDSMPPAAALELLAEVVNKTNTRREFMENITEVKDVLQARINQQPASQRGRAENR